MSFKEVAFTAVGIPTGLKRAYEVVKPYNISNEAKIGLTALLSPIAFAVPELLNTCTALRNKNYVTAVTYVAAGLVNAVGQVVSGVRCAEAAMHLAELAHIDPTLAGVVGFAVASLGSRVYHNVIQNITHETGNDTAETISVQASNTLEFMFNIAPAAIFGI